MNAPDSSPLFAPFRVGGITLRNRFVVPSMQRGVSEDGKPTPRLADYYRRFAEGGFALVMSEACAIDHASAGQEGRIVRMTPATQEAWRPCIANVRNAGAHMMIQLYHHGGMRKDGGANGDSAAPTISPSGLATGSQPGGRAATAAELEDLKQSYARSAVLAREAGAAGVELHAGHGFLLDQFLWAETNHRQDGYGGPDMADRVRFPAEVVAAVRAATGDDFVISLRFSQWKQLDYTAKVVAAPGELEVMLRGLRGAGVDMFHVSTRSFSKPEWPGSDRALAGWTKALTDAPVLTVGSVGASGDLQSLYLESEAREEAPESVTAASLVELMRRFDLGEFDLVAVGRASIGDPDWVNKVAAGHFSDIKLFRREDLLNIIASFNPQARRAQQEAARAAGSVPPAP
ncbi:MAG: 12-oxophytodienoate reductase [Bradyrhizobium sp.]|nr:12-oxophytodienoate reductase [Bradyrhizobium sp.]